jgi:hypothetical protein
MAAFLKARERNEQLIKSVAEELDTVAPKLRNPLPAGAPFTPASFIGVLRKYRRLGRLPGLSTHAHLAIRKEYEAAFARIFRWMSFSPRDFGAKNFSELADTFVTMLERTGYHRFPQSKLPSLRGTFAGELLELLVQKHELWQKDLKVMAKAQVDLLNLLAAAQEELLNSKMGTLVDAHFTPVPAAGLKGKFGLPRKATDIVIVNSKGGRPRKFIDLAYVSEFEHESGSGLNMWSFLVETEIRMATKAKKAGKQIGRAQARFDFATGDKIKMVVDGEAEPVYLEAEQIIFAPTSIDRTLVTVPKPKPFRLVRIPDTPQYRPSFTTRGGYPEYFWRLEVAMDTEEIWRMVNELPR